MNLKGLCGIVVAWLAVAGVVKGQTWTSQGVGNVGASGTFTVISVDAFSVAGSGTDIGGTADAFQFVYQTLAGDGEVVARVASVPYTDAWSKAGLSIRESLDAGSMHATVILSRDNGVQYTLRSATSGTTAIKVTVNGRYAPQWLKVIRSGTNFSTYTSKDGVAWGLLGSDNIPMTGTVYVGMAVTSHTNTQLGLAGFDNVSIADGTVSDATAPQTPVVSIGERSKAGIALSWGAVADDVGVSAYEVRRNGTLVATLPGTSSSYLNTLLSATTAYSYTVKALDVSGKASDSSVAVSGTTHAASNGIVSASQDIGSVGITGSTTYNSTTSTYTLAASGANIGSTSDSFRFAYQQCSGDVAIVARVSAIESTGAKEGVMIRESLSANAPGASLIIYNNSVMFQSRKSAGGSTTVSTSIPTKGGFAWLKLVRVVNAFKGYTSADGVNWQYVGSNTITMASSAYAGLALTSFNNTMRFSASFTNLDISGPVDSQAPSVPYGLNLYSFSDVSFSLAWPVSSDDVVVDGYKIFQDGIQIATTPFARYTETFQYPASTHTYSIQAYDPAGNLSAVSDPLSVTLPSPTLPAPWEHDDLGTIEWAGSASLSGSTFGITGAGLDIGGTLDGFHYIYQPLNGDQTIVARVASIPNAPNSSVKAGVMIRQTLDAGARNAMMLIKSGSGAYLQLRGSTNGSATTVNGNLSAKVPYWLKLVRSGSRFAGYQSGDGANWTLAGSGTVSMGTSGYIGLAITSHDAFTPATAMFDSVQITPDSDNNGLSDSWELNWFNQIGVDPNAVAPRNDGLTNLQAFQQGLNPIDYYNSVAPKLTKISGDNQNGSINAFLAQPFVISLCASGTGNVPLVNAPVTVTVPQGGGLVAAAASGSASAASVFHSDTNGRVSIYYQEGTNWGTASSVSVVAGKSSTTFAATASPQVGHWTFNSQSGSTASDSSNTGNAGNLIGGVTWGVGFDGNGAIILDGSSGYLEVPATPSINSGTGSLSITAWVRLPQGVTLSDETTIYPIATLGDGSVDVLSLRLRGGHGLEAQVNTSTGFVQVDGIVDAAVVTDGAWHQVGFVYDANGTVTVVFDGTILNTQTGIQILPVSSPRIWLGRDGAGHYFSGSIDEVDLRREALTASRLADGNSDGMPDLWEYKYFGTLGVSGTADFDGDGVSNLQEYLNGTNPSDYYNGVAPLLFKASGDNQNGAANCFLAQALSVLVTSADGTPLANAPVTFNVTSGGGIVAATTSSTTQLTSLVVRTGTDGKATACYKSGSSFGVDSQVQAIASNSSCVFSVTASRLVAQWNYEDGSGLIASDSSATGNPSNLNGGVAWAVGYNGQEAVVLDGSTGYLASGPNGAFAIGGTNKLTVATWIRLPRNLPLGIAQTNGIYPIATFGTSTADSLSFVIQSRVNGVDLMLNNGATNVAIATFDPATVANGDWHHVAFSYDGSGNVTLVFDGALLTSKAGVQITANSSPRVWLGRDMAGHYLKGGLDDSMISRDALTQLDIQNFYTAGISNGGMANWWKWKQFGTLDVDPSGVTGDDGVSNLQKYQSVTTPVVNIDDIPDLPAGRGVHGKVLWERWSGPELRDTFIEDIRRFGKYPLNPDETYSLSTFEIQPSAGKVCSASRLRAYVVPQITGPYCFYVTGQEWASLYVSLTGKTYTRQLACGASNIAPNTWTKFSGTYYLQAGTRYYLEFIVKGEKYPAFAQAAWTTPLDSAPKLIPSQNLISMGAEDDTNDVGMSDAWQLTHFGSLNQWSNQDPDRDGLTNLQEFALGTDPMNADTGAAGVSDAGKAAGYLTYDYWLNVSGTSATDFVASSRYAQGPDGRCIVNGTTEPIILSQNCATAFRGYFAPTVSGTYKFQSGAGSEGVAAYLSTDSSPANMQLLFSKLSTPATRTLTAGQRYYFELIHKTGTATQPVTLSWMPPGATAYTVIDSTKFFPLDALAVSPQAPLPNSWQRGDIYVNRGWTSYPGLSSIDDSGTLEILSTGKGINTHSDGMHWVYQELPDGGQIQARILSCQYPTSTRTSGVMIRQSLAAGSQMAMLRTTTDGAISFSCRLDPDGYAVNDSPVAHTGAVWLRLLRKGSSVYAYISEDGNQWYLFDQANLNLSGSAYVGVFASSGAETQFCRALFDNLSASVDPVIAASSSPVDSDGDGYTDYEETQFLHSNPLVNDLQPATTVTHLAGSAGNSAIGTWSSDGGAIYNIGVRGAVDYTVTVPQNGIYRIAIQGTPRVNTISDLSWDVLISVDGQYLETANYQLAMGQSGIAHVYTPWLKAGSHTIRLYLDNVSIYRSFSFTSVDIQAINGVDANNNGIPDWMENRTAAQDGITSLAAQSRTSPFCLEGAARYQHATKLTVDNVPLQVMQGVGDGWYANVPLNADAPVAVSAEFENGGKIDQKAITWLITDLLNPGVPDNTLKIRKGDALLLSAVPAEATSGTAAITVALPDQTVATLQTTGTQTLQYQFAQSGTYTLNATYQDGTNPNVSGTLTVQVMEASFAKPNPILTLGYYREWLNPLISADTVVESDSRLGVIELTPPATGGRNFQLRIDAPETRVMLARLNDGTQKGPILDQAIANGLEVSSGLQTGVYLVEQYNDGSRLVEMRVILSNIPDDFRAKFSGFAAGVTLEDGSLEKWVTKADFDAQGQLKIRFIIAPNASTSICHRLYIYQGDTLLESRLN